MSSRNAYLSVEQRAIAPAIHRVLSSLGDRLRGGDEAAPLLTESRDSLIAAGFASVDYLELRDAETLEPLPRADRPARLLVAARLGKARLIDNIAV
jgi:pantoate--beta-alanine ligase